MVYSNNIFFKFFVVLLIFVFCFLLFTKFNIVYAGFETIEYNNKTFPVSDFFDDYYYILFVYYKNSWTLGYAFSDAPFKYSGNGNWSFADNSRHAAVYVSRSNSEINNNLNYFNKSSYSFNNSTGYPTSIFIEPELSVYNNFDITDLSGNVVFENNYIRYPSIENTMNSFETLDFDTITVNANDWIDKDFDILFYDRNVVNTSSTEGLYPKRVITLNKNSSYYKPYLSTEKYYIPIDEVGLNFYTGGTYEIRFAEKVILDPPVSGADYSYTYLGEPIQFTVSANVAQDKINAINKEIEDTTEKKYHDETIESMNSINNNINNVNNALTNTTPDNSVNTDITSSLAFDNQNETLNNINGGFFSRLTSLLSSLVGYNLGDDTAVSIPLPNSEQSIVLHSKDIYDNVSGVLRVIINAFWLYIFTFYMYKFINKIYIAVSTGNILDTFSSSGEAITNDML